MLAVAPSTVQAVDGTIQILGGFIAIALALAALRSGSARNPLSGIVAPSDGPAVAHVVAVLFVYFFAAFLLASLVAAVSAGDPTTPGSSAWHTLQLTDIVARLAAVTCACTILSYQPRPAESSPRPLTLARAFPIALVATLVLVPVCTVQLSTTSLIWNWAHPNATRPVHVVLQALERSEWKSWGTVELFVSAVVAAPLAEEYFFRGILLPALWRSLGRAWPAALLCGFLFGIVHIAQPQDVLPLVTMGTALSYLRIRYDSLLPCVLTHMLFNTRTMVAAILAPEMING